MRSEQLRTTWVGSLLIVLTLGVVPAALAATGDLSNTKIAFTSNRDGNYEIYTVNYDGTGLQRLTNNTFLDVVPSWSPDGSKLVFLSDRDGNDEIYVMNADGSSPTRLTNNTAHDGGPTWSPDGSKILFHSNRLTGTGVMQVYTMDPNGANQTQITSGAGHHNASWSPDGTRIAYQGYESGQARVYVANADGSSPIDVTAPSNGYSPYWSPDGTTIVYSSYDGAWHLHLVDPTGANQRTLPGTFDGPYLSWSPDGAWIIEGPHPSEMRGLMIIDPVSGSVTAYTSPAGAYGDGFPSWSSYFLPAALLNTTTVNLGTVTKPGSGTATFNITNSGGGTLTVSGIASSNAQFTVSPAPPYNLAAGQSQTVTVTFTPTVVGWEQSALTITHNASGSPSTVTAKGIGRINPPTGNITQTKVAFTSDRDGNREVYVTNADGTGSVNLTNDPGDDDWASWSPDGTRIAFRAIRSSNADIYVMNADGTGSIRLTTDNAVDAWPVWSPDGTKIAFYSTRDGNREVYVMNADGTGQVNLTNNPATDDEPAWSPDGTKLLFSTRRDGNDETYVMNADGTNPANLTNHSADEHQPAWSPDGTKIAFMSYRDANWEIYVMNADGTSPIRLTSSAGDDLGPSWSPDGTKIAFESYRDGNFEIYTMNADGSGPVNLTNSLGNDFSASWSPFLAPALPSYQNWTATLRLTGDPAGDHTVTVGVSLDATDAVNLSLEDTLAPPMPQPPASWLRLLRGGQALSQDVLAFADARTWTIEVEVGSGTHYLSIEGLPEGVLAYYNDNPRIVHGPDTDATTAAVHPLPLGASIPLNTGTHLLTLVLSKRLPQTLATTLGIRWRMFSLPGPATNAAPSNLVTRGVVSMYGYGYFDASTPPVWIENYQQVTLASTQPLPFVGKGWFIFRDPTNGPLNTTFQVDVGDPAAQEVVVTLQPRWNLVGAPFGGAPASAYNPTAKTVFGYDGVNYVIATSLSQFQGYWVYNELASARTVTITQTPPTAPAIAQRAAPSPDWVAPLTISLDSGALKTVELGSGSKAQVGFDAYDVGLPPAPPIRSYSEFYAATDDPVERMSRSILPSNQREATWELSANLAEAGTLRWTAQTLPAGFRIVVELGDERYDLSRDGSMRLDAGKHTFTARLTFAPPSRSRLMANYPNPFNPETWIPFELKESSAVTVSVYDVAGSLVRKLDVGYREPGYYTSRDEAAYWDGRNELGERVASGVYFYELRAGSFRETRRMVIHK